MSAAHESDPFELLVEANMPASPDEINVAVNLANGLIETVPAELHKQYALASESGMLKLSTMGHEAYSGLPYAFANLTDIDGESFMEIAFSPDNSPSHIYYPEPARLALAPLVAQDLLEADIEDEREMTVARTIQSLAFSLLMDSYSSGMFNDGTLDGHNQPLAVTIRQLVDSKAPQTMHIKDWGIALDIRNSLAISSHTFSGQAEELEDILESTDIPQLEVELSDRKTHFNQCLVKTLAGDVSMHTYSQAELLKAEANDEDDNEDDDDSEAEYEIEEYMEELGAYKPTRQGIKLLTDKLLEAVTLEADVPDDLSEWLG